MAFNANEFPVDIPAHVLPILELCRFAAMAQSAVSSLYDLANIDPAFRDRLRDAVPSLSELADSHGGDQVAAALWVAIDLLERYDMQPPKGRA